MKVQTNIKAGDGDAAPIRIPNHNQTLVRPAVPIRIANHNQTVIRSAK